MDLCDLFPSPGSRRRRKRVGRGIAAGQGKTCGRGTKGDKARGQSKIAFEGGQTPLHRRLPRRRGFTNIFRREFVEANVRELERFDAGTEVTPELLLEKRIIRRVLDGLKILGEGKLTKSLTVKAHAFSKQAIVKIEAAGGKVIVIGGAAKPAKAKPAKPESQPPASEPESEDAQEQE